MNVTTFIHANVFDGETPDYLRDHYVIVEGSNIVEVGAGRCSNPLGETIDVLGRVLMPGLIDAHCHVLGSSLRISEIESQPLTYVAQHAGRMLERALDCGFTTVRDVGGGEIGIARAVDDGLIAGPRVLFSGRALSMTGGHGDFRDPFASLGACCHGENGRISVLVDGEDAVRRAAREELSRGAHCLKLMMSGGVLSPGDPLWMDQFTDGEISAAIDEARRRRTYVAAHCHPASSITRAAQLGVRSIEHATLMDEASAATVKAADAFVVPTLVIVRALMEGAAGPLPGWAQDKLQEVSQCSLRGLEIMDRADLKIGFGTDLLGQSHVQQTREFSLRREVQSAAAILRSATSVNADLLMQPTLGRIKVGARADLLIVDGDPLQDINVLAADGRKLDAIMKAGRFHKSEALRR